MTPRLEVCTRRQGVLSRVGHDLRLRTEQITVRRQGAEVHVDMPASSLRVVCAMHQGRDAPHALSERDRREIERSLHQTILQVTRHPQLRFSGHVDASGMHGQATVRGQSRYITLRWCADGVATGMVDHRDFGIPVFTALLGALRVDPVVAITAWLPMNTGF